MNDKRNYIADDVDRQVLEILQVSGRASASHIADKIEMSIPAVSERIRKLQDSGVISGFKAVVNPRSVGLDVSALITVVSETSAHYGEIVENAKNNREILRCFSTTGRGSHVLFVQTENTASLEKLLREIQTWPGVDRTETQLILSSYKELSPIHIPC